MTSRPHRRPRPLALVPRWQRLFKSRCGISRIWNANIASRCYEWGRAVRYDEVAIAKLTEATRKPARPPIPLPDFKGTKLPLRVDYDKLLAELTKRTRRKKPLASKEAAAKSRGRS